MRTPGRLGARRARLVALSGAQRHALAVAAQPLAQRLSVIDRVCLAVRAHPVLALIATAAVMALARKRLHALGTFLVKRALL